MTTDERLYDRIADLPLTIDAVSGETNRAETSSGFTRVTTTVALDGSAATGRGEDVTYDPDEHDPYDPRRFDLTGTYTIEEFAARLDDIDLFPDGDPEQAASRRYRRWSFESAALDLALAQAGESIDDVLCRSFDPVSFVVSTRLGDPPSPDRIDQWLAIDPTLRFKLDPTSDWDDDLVSHLAKTGAVEILDLKAFYEGTTVDQPPDPALYERIVEGFPDARIEDPAFTPDTEPILSGHEERIRWDEPITGIDSLDERQVAVTGINVKPSRFGDLASLLDTIQYCRRRNIELYGGGQFELDVGRQHLHVFAGLFYADAPNDVAPRGYNRPEPTADLPRSPLEPPAEPVAFRWT